MKKSMALIVLTACGVQPIRNVTAVTADATEDIRVDDLTSHRATLYTLEFDTEGLYSQTPSRDEIVQSQLFYTIGHMNGDKGVGRLDDTQVTNIVGSADAASGRVLAKYHVSMQVAWNNSFLAPKVYAMKLPRDMTRLDAFARKYGTTCIGWEGGAHTLTQDDLWYYYRTQPKLAPNCRLADADVVTIGAKVTRSPDNTSGKFPEYDKVWEDRKLNVVLIFGKYESGNLSAEKDPTINSYTKFHDDAVFFVSQTGATYTRQVAAEPEITIYPTTTANKIPSAPRVRDGLTTLVKYRGTFADGREFNLTTLLVDSLQRTNADFDQRYATLSRDADLIMYVGHAALGGNVRALARKGSFCKNKYQIVFMNGCDTFAYVDGFMAKRKTQVNPEDTAGTKFLDMVTTIQPVVPDDTRAASVSFIKALLDVKNPLTFETIFRTFAPTVSGAQYGETTVVTGENDNTFNPLKTPNWLPLAGTPAVQYNECEAR